MQVQRLRPTQLALPAAAASARPRLSSRVSERAPLTRRPSTSVNASAQQLSDSHHLEAGDVGTLSRRGLLSVAAGVACLAAVPAGSVAAPASAYDFTVKQYGEDVSLSQFKDCVTVFVNIASE
mmetsp:Transcript_35776/g.101257  ORF Transcript_35776/g.101257 Transcript_35776/m.101257 type:complete len:123 (+) Transcript_35776:129-497(+)